MIDVQARERALVVAVAFRRARYHDPWPLEDAVAELRELVRSTGVEIVGEQVIAREAPIPGLMIGRGRAEALHLAVEAERADVVVINHDLSSAQQRNLEALLGAKVIDRTQLILDLFAQRAHSQEGKVQVALAQHEYLLPRLAGKGILLSRLGGGIGTRGPGEQKLETDRRRIRARIAKLHQELAEIRQRRRRSRQERRVNVVPTVALVGYTNVGKTTVLNAVTKSQAAVHDQLFTTLDPISRRLLLPTHQPIILSDTVGFLHQLPHHLIEAFQATLEEVQEADLLLHVVDAGHPLRDRQVAAVEQVLSQLGVEAAPRLLVFNKVDRISTLERQQIQRQMPEAILLSALTGEGLPHLMDRVVQQVGALSPSERNSMADGAWVPRPFA